MAWKGTGKVGWESAVQTLVSTERAPPNEQRELGGGTSSFPSFPGSSPHPHLNNSRLCGLVFLAQSGCESIPHPTAMSLSLKEADALETETKLFEDLEFQQLERESRVEEERELAGQGLLRSKAELLRSVTKRKVCTYCPGAGWRRL